MTVTGPERKLCGLIREDHAIWVAEAQRRA
jgi:hypothetical protein